MLFFPGEPEQALGVPGTWMRWLYIFDSWLLHLSRGVGKRYCPHPQKQVEVPLVLSDRLREGKRSGYFGVWFEDAICGFFTLQEVVRSQRD